MVTRSRYTRQVQAGTIKRSDCLAVIAVGINALKLFAQLEAEAKCNFEDHRLRHGATVEPAGYGEQEATNDMRMKPRTLRAQTQTKVLVKLDR